jgi:WD40 repeat protein
MSIQKATINSEPTFLKKQVLSSHSAAVYSLAYDGVQLYSSSADKYVTRWDLELGTQDKFAIKFSNSPYSICLFDANTKLAVGLDNGNLHFFDLKERKELKFYVQHKSGIFSILENPTKQQLFTTDAEGNLAVWNTQDLHLQLILPFDCGKIRRMALNSDGSKLFLACQDGTVRVLETDFFNQLEDFYAHVDGVSSIAVNPQNTLLFTGGKDAILRIWDLQTFQQVKAIPAHNYVIYDIQFLSDEQFITVSRDKSIKIWDATTLTVAQKIEFKNGGHIHSVNKIQRIDSETFATCSDDKKIIVWRRSISNL